MNKIIKTLAITALFCFPGLSGFPQEVPQEETPAVQATQLTDGHVIRLAPGRQYWP